MIGIYRFVGYRHVESGTGMTNTNGYATIYFSRSFKKIPVVNVIPIDQSFISIKEINTSYFVVYGYNFSLSTAGIHSHYTDGISHTHNIYGSFDTVGAHTHTVTTDTKGEHTHEIYVTTSIAYGIVSVSYYNATVYDCYDKCVTVTNLVNTYYTVSIPSADHIHGMSLSGEHIHTVTLHGTGAHTHIFTGSIESSGLHLHTVLTSGSHTHSAITYGQSISFRWIAICTE